MKGTAIHLDHIGDRAVAARIVDGRLDDLLVAPSDGRPVPGAIYRAVVDRPMKGQGGVTVRLPSGRGFLRQSKGLSPGQVVTVQVTSFADDGKAVPVTTRILFKSRHAIATPGAPGLNVSRRIRDEDVRDRLLEVAHDAAERPEGMGLIVRSGAETADMAAVADDVADTVALARQVMAEAGQEAELLVDGPDPHMLAWRDWPDPDTLETEPGNMAASGVLDAIAALADPHVDLGGPWIAIEPTRALTAVDVNTGGDTSLSAGLKANIAAARALPAHLRCRGIGGQITLDLAPMAKKERRGFEQVLRAAFRTDPVETTLAGWTPLGLFELQRKRDRLPLDLEV